MEGTSLISISVKGMDPEDQALVVNAVAKEFVDSQAVWNDTVTRNERARRDEFAEELSRRLQIRKTEYLDLAASMDQEENEYNKNRINAGNEIGDSDLQREEI